MERYIARQNLITRLAGLAVLILCLAQPPIGRAGDRCHRLSAITEMVPSSLPVSRYFLL